MEGYVIHGEKRGRILGYPTANIDTTIPPHVSDGIYSGYLQVDNTIYESAVSIGTNPTFNGKTRNVEVFILGVKDVNLYGKWVKLILGHKIRDQIKFNSVDDLIEQIKDDIYIIQSMV